MSEREKPTVKVPKRELSASQRVKHSRPTGAQISASRPTPNTDAKWWVVACLCIMGIVMAYCIAKELS